MGGFRFEWDEAKNASNKRKHGISFEEASELFFDPHHIVTADRVVDGEQRWQALGQIFKPGQRHLLVLAAHTVEDLESDGIVEIVRIISARRATPIERRSYEDENG